MIDLESDLEELHDSEQRWATKHKRAIEQVNTLETGSELTEHLQDFKNIDGQFQHSLYWLD